MDVSYSLRHLLALVLIPALHATCFANPAAIEQTATAPIVTTAPPADALRWTPHRPSSAAPDGPVSDSSVANADAQPTVSQPMLSPKQTPRQPSAALPPASVSLSDGMPSAQRIAPNTRNSGSGMPDDTYAPLRGRMGEWMSPNRIAGALRSSADTSVPAGLLSTSILRAPQGEHGRPILGIEGVQRRPTEIQAAAKIPLVGGGEAPRFNVNAARMAQGRNDRLAMNVDGLPSVINRGPQAAAIDDSAVPNRIPSGGSTGSPTLSGPLPNPAQTEDTGTYSPRQSVPMEMNSMDMGMGGSSDAGEYGEQMASPDDQGGMWMGEYPVHVPSPYDDPYACEDGEACGCIPMWEYHDGRICAYLRRFGRPYYGWRWYRDFTASAGITSFQNSTNLGLHGNYGTNEYANWSMPFWNAFGIGWQLGVRGVQANFQSTELKNASGDTLLKQNARNQFFLTTGFFTRAFEGRGLQGGVVYDYLRDNWYDDVDVSQVRGELSYVWGYHEVGFWGAANVADTNGIFGSTSTAPTNSASTLDLYTAFYRMQFGDANEWKVWGGATGSSDGIIGTLLRAPMTRSLAMEGTFTYVIPGPSQTVVLPPPGGGTIRYSEQAWNVSVNLVYYPACRSRRSLASPYRPLFDVADNGSMIRSISIPKP